jgi:hypothetical protein
VQFHIPSIIKWSLETFSVAMGRTAVKVSVANTAVEPKIFELVT